MIDRSVKGAVALWLWAALVMPASAQDMAGDPARGGELFRARCFACHSPDTDRVGPRLAGVFGREAGTVPGYAYSPALAGAGIVWDRRSLDSWLAGPRAFVPGARMPLAVSNAADRLDLIAYLAALTLNTVR